jgi:hypothetical protein
VEESVEELICWCANKNILTSSRGVTLDETLWLSNSLEILSIYSIKICLNLSWNKDAGSPSRLEMQAEGFEFTKPNSAT